MRIIYHHRTRATDAQKVHIVEMVNAFRDLGHDVEIVSLVNTEGQSDDPSKEGFPTRWQRLVRRIPMAYEFVQLAYNIIGIPLLLWRVLRLSPDFLYERYSLFNFTGVMVAKMTRKPIVLEVNSPFALEQARDRHIRAVRLAQWVERRICNSANRVVVVTESLRQILMSNGVGPDRLLTMHNGVNAGRFARRTSKALQARLGLENKFVIGFVGWFRKWHALHLLIQAFHHSGLSRQGAVLLLVGDGPEMKVLRRQIEGLQAEESIVLPGAVPHSMIPEYIGLFDAGVQAAANEYCCPMKILEYMALGKPIVAPRQSNVLELLTDEEAILFTPGNVEALSRALKELVVNPQRAATCGMRARAVLDYRGLFWHRNAQRVTQLFAAARAASAS